MVQVRELVWDSMGAHAAEIRSLTTDLAVHNYPLQKPAPAHVRAMDRCALV